MVTRRVSHRQRRAAARLVAQVDKKRPKLPTKLLHCRLNDLQELNSSRDRVQSLEQRAPSSGALQPSASLASKGSEKAKTVISVAARQSGVKGVTWQAQNKAWRAQWTEGGQKKYKQFYVRRYMESSGKSYREADAHALHDAIAFREGLVKDGLIKAPTASRQSAIRGVYWLRGSWRVQISVDGKMICGGSFHPRDHTPEEIERARLAAVGRRRQLELEHYEIRTKEAADPSERQKKRESGVTGITWSCKGLYWRIQSRVQGKTINKSFPPKDLTEESIEAGRLMAVQELKRCEASSPQSP